MTARTEPDGFKRDSVQRRLASTYRCQMCHKQCLVPCRFTAAEFKMMVAQYAEELKARDAAHQPGATDGRSDGAESV
jgi:hypothetical protein